MLERDGFAILPAVWPADVVADVAQRIATVLQQEQPGTVLDRQGVQYGARNLLGLCPALRNTWRVSRIEKLLLRVLGPRAGLVRALYFDKPPGAGWSLPWHRDQTIAVQNNALPSAFFSRPTNKAGIPHVTAPRELLEQMLTLRFHLDAMHEANGPLVVLPGSHRTDDLADDGPAATICLQAGDCFLMRPLLAHCSRGVAEDAPFHRRVVHLEFAAAPDLPDGYAWREFWPVAESLEGSPR